MAILDAMNQAGDGLSQALPANSQSQLDAAIGAVTDDIVSKIASSTAATVPSVQVSSSNDVAFVSSYNAGNWTGNLNAFTINLTTGNPTTTSVWTAGSAKTQLNNTTPSTRYIVAGTDTAGTTGGVQFEFPPITGATVTALSSAQQALLNSPSTPPGPSDGAAVLAYLRGNRSGELTNTYRVRADLLGDIIDSVPTVVGPPNQAYTDAGYSTFTANNSARQEIVYQGANDGMMHAFSATTGTELWAYIPNLVMANLNALTRKNYSHEYTVDGTPSTGDVDFGNGNWHTILVGGLNKGGRGYYALDITDGSTPISEAGVTSKILWEFPNSITDTNARAQAKLNMGYSFGQPLIVKTKASGWVVLVTSGYNNGTNTGDSGGDGNAHLFVINPQTGDLIQDIVTSGCNATPLSNPCGLAQISAYQNNQYNPLIDIVYGGDLYGNLWRFDLSGATVSSWTAGLMATLVDASGNTQPITTAPELSVVNSGHGQRYVFVGTGEYLGNSDVSTTQVQTMYALYDAMNGVTLPHGTGTSSLRSHLQKNTLAVGSSITINGVQTPTETVTVGTPPSSSDGWYMDLQLNTGERVVTNPSIVFNALVFTTDIPSTTPCIPGGSSYQYFLDISTGAMLKGSKFAALLMGKALSSRPTLLQLPPSGELPGNIQSVVVESNATTVSTQVPISFSLPAMQKIGWKEILRQ